MILGIFCVFSSSYSFFSPPISLSSRSSFYCLLCMYAWIRFKIDSASLYNVQLLQIAIKKHYRRVWLEEKKTKRQKKKKKKKKDAVWRLGLIGTDHGATTNIWGSSQASSR